MTLRIPNIEITRHPAPNADEDLADKKSSVTDRPPTEKMTYSLTITTAARSTFLRIAGNLDYETTDDLVDVATRLLAQQKNLSDRTWTSVNCRFWTQRLYPGC